MELHIRCASDCAPPPDLRAAQVAVFSNLRFASGTHQRLVQLYFEMTVTTAKNEVRSLTQYISYEISVIYFHEKTRRS
jgi:hypothetical protein